MERETKKGHEMKYAEEMKKLMTSGGKTGAMTEKIKEILDQKRQFEEDMAEFRLEREIAKARIDDCFKRLENLIRRFLEGKRRCGKEA